MTAIIERSDRRFWRRTEPSGGGEDAERLNRAQALMDAFLAELHSRHQGYPWDVKPEQFASGQAMLAATPDLQAALVVVAVATLIAGAEPRKTMPNVYEMRALLPRLLRRNLPFRESDLHAILEAMTASRITWATWVPVRVIARAIQRWSADRPLSQETRERLRRLCASAEGRYVYADERKGLEVLKSLLGETEPRLLIDPADDWGAAALETMNALDPEVAASWQRVLEHAATANAPRPSANWLKGAAVRIDAVGEERFASMAAEWLLLMKRPASVRTRIGSDGHLVPASIVTDRNGTLLKGLAWMCAQLEGRSPAAVLGDAAIACFAKIPNVGPRCLKAGNGCINALAAMPAMDGVAQLVRLQERVTHGQARNLIESSINDAARRTGLTRHDLADLAVPTFDLVDGRLNRALGAFTAEIAIGADGRAAVAWFDADGKARKSEPAEVKRSHAAELKELKRTAKDIEAMLGAQRLRIERFLMTDRDWSYPEWRTRLLDHPLLSFFAQRLIWSFTSPDWTVAGCWLDGRLVDHEDMPMAEPGPRDRVRLFHPVLADEETIRGWQLWLERHRITQPFKQAHREVYRLTEAERTAEIRSARFAGHILQQHQLAALCKHRGWDYRLQSTMFDSANTPTLALHSTGLFVEFDVEPIEGEGDEATTAAGISRFVSSGHVIFRRGRGLRAQPVRLEEIAPALFSEVMRDVDLFVGVCSIGNDPTWQERAGDRYDAYWRDRSFGDLTQAAQGRRELLARLLPALAIAPRCSLDDRFLIVGGDLRTYQIHLGSGNILMEPNNEYLCIVQQPWGEGAKASERIYLPFEGDSVLSLILSKALLLAKDSAITDPTILRQIRRS